MVKGESKYDGYVLETRNKIGGENRTVEIDESVFSKRKYNKGRMAMQKWVVGGIERESRKMFLIHMEKRDAKALTKVIKENVEKKTKIVIIKGKVTQNLKKVTMNT